MQRRKRFQKLRQRVNTIRQQKNRVHSRHKHLPRQVHKTSHQTRIVAPSPKINRKGSIKPPRQVRQRPRPVHTKNSGINRYSTQTPLSSNSYTATTATTASGQIKLTERKNIYPHVVSSKTTDSVQIRAKLGNISSPLLHPNYKPTVLPHIRSVYENNQKSLPHNIEPPPVKSTNTKLAIRHKKENANIGPPPNDLHFISPLAPSYKVKKTPPKKVGLKLNKKRDEVDCTGFEVKESKEKDSKRQHSFIPTPEDIRPAQISTVQQRLEQQIEKQRKQQIKAHLEKKRMKKHQRVKESKTQKNGQGIWHGVNIHAYTHQINQMVSKYVPELTQKYGKKVEQLEFNELLEQLEKTYGSKVTYSNLRKVYKNGWIVDPQVRSMNSAILLKAVWEKVKDKGDESIYRHFSETLDEIGATCIQGVSFRLFIDYVALTEDENSKHIHKFNNILNSEHK